MSAIYLDNTHLVRITLFARNATSGANVAETGRTDGFAWLSATKNGDALDPSLSVALTEVGTDGVYTAEIGGATITAALAGYEAGFVFEVVQFGTDERSSRRLAFLADRVTGTD